MSPAILTFGYFVLDQCDSGGLKPVNAYSLGWKPRWDEQKFLEHADEEVEAVLGADAVRTSVFDKVMTDGTN